MSRPFILFLFFFTLSTVTASAEQSTCYQSTLTWTSLSDLEAQRILQDHVRKKCQFAGSWVAKYREVSNKNKRKRMCDDLVLIWTHKECNYFREYITPDVFEPCKQWTREMFDHCMENERAWFSSEN